MTAALGDKSAVFLRGGCPGCLCLHGFTGTPFEVRPIAEALSPAWLHRQRPGAGRPLRDGPGAGADPLARLAGLGRSGAGSIAGRTGGPVAIAGFSLGGLLALRLARKRPEQSPPSR